MQSSDSIMTEVKEILIADLKTATIEKVKDAIWTGINSFSVKDFQTSVKSVIKNYAKFTGRASRAEFWYWALFNILIGIAFTVLASILMILHMAALAPVFTLCAMVVRLALLVPTIAVGIRRLHDVDHKGWWLLIGLTIIGGIFPLFYWAVLPGTDGANRFGNKE